MPAVPPIFPVAGLRFLAALREHNTLAWFHANKATYQACVRAPMLTIVAAVNAELAKFAPRYQAQLPRAVSRPNRDTRFSADKSPYRSDISAVFPCDGLEKHLAAGFFFRISPDGADVIGGAVVPGPDELRQLREFVSRQHARLRKELAVPALRKLMGPLKGDVLKKVPKPFATDHAAADLLRQKQFYLEARLSPKMVTSSNLVTELAARFRAMTPFVRVLDEGLGRRP